MHSSLTKYCPADWELFAWRLNARTSLAAQVSGYLTFSFSVICASITDPTARGEREKMRLVSASHLPSSTMDKSLSQQETNNSPDAHIPPPSHPTGQPLNRFQLSTIPALVLLSLVNLFIGAVLVNSCPIPMTIDIITTAACATIQVMLLVSLGLGVWNGGVPSICGGLLLVRTHKQSCSVCLLF